MTKRIEFLFDFGSPTSYLAFGRLLQLKSSREIDIKWTPVLLGGIMQAVGNTPPTVIPVKAKWFFDDLMNWSKEYHLPFNANPHFPMNTLTIMRGAVALQERAEFLPYLQAVFSKMWEQGKNINDEAVLGEVLASIGVDAEWFREAIQVATVKEKLKANTQEAVKRGVFGCPTFFVGDQMFFGQDRLQFVERSALQV